MDVQGHYALQTLLKILVQQGYTLVISTEYAFDSYFYADCPSKDPSQICWNDGANPDKTYLLELLDRAKNHVAFDKISVMGYSVGAQMVSRLINESLSAPESYPKLDVCIFIAGGSMFCYDNNYVKDCKKPTGCCPPGHTEQYFLSNGNWDMHPPCILCQSSNDMYADPDAADYYFDELKKHNVRATEMICNGVRRMEFVASRWTSYLIVCPR